MHGKRMVFDLGYDNQRRKRAILEDERLTIQFEKDSATSVSEEVCETAYDAYGSCAPDFEPKIDCEMLKEDFVASNADMWAVRYASNFPGFNRDGMRSECYAACKSGKLATYEDFRSKVCRTEPRQ